MADYPYILSALQGRQWAMTPEAMTGLLRAVDGSIGDDDYSVFHGAEPGTVEAITENMGSPPANDPDNDYVRIKGSVGTLLIDGPIVPRSSRSWKSSGINSIQQLSAGLRLLEANEDIEDIVLFMDTPGGAVTGLSDFAEQVATSMKRTTAYIFGACASAGYFIASQADYIVSANSGMIGSIGTILGLKKRDDDMIEIVSSQSPNKNADPESKEGKAQYQEIVNDHASIFIDAVASGRGVDSKTVLKDFGQGAMLIAAKAQAAGMIDSIMMLGEFQENLTAGTLDRPSLRVRQEEVVNIATSQKGKKPKAATSGKGLKMTLEEMKTSHPVAYAAAVAEGVAQERDRVEAHLELGKASGDMETAIAAISKGDGLTEKCKAKYMAASMNRQDVQSRNADNPGDLGTDTSDGAPGPEDIEAKVDAAIAKEFGSIEEVI